MRLTIIILAILLAACSTDPIMAEQPSDSENLIAFTGRIIHVNLEGGFYGIEDQAGHHYLPDHIPPALRRDGQPVRVKARPAPPAVGFRMWGQRIIIEEISAP
ncbi:hypothetical protein C2E25_05155 [Geothermobacter hydrogeniphilus]|uniref:Uncharacterized protein n=1 Tax=Geothermobacter hydrogeniphilus TaxID=1969733 RepID=A0A2K2HC06_9BACT|nr:hypothetical protein [Geothermobacter hydrogeniphilus]PNU20780.1 hypothetical protein C2E25_05155 [Geothermobacter hydrogeniphilus]